MGLDQFFGDFGAMWPIILMVVIFYFLLYRPQKKQQKQRQEMLNSLKKGAKVVTVGGMIGTIISINDENVVLRVADKVEIKFTRTAINEVLGGKEGKESKESKAEKESNESEDSDKKD